MILQRMRNNSTDIDEREALRKAMHALLDEEIFDGKNPFK